MFVIVQDIDDDDSCDSNEEYNRCGTQCQVTCNDVNAPRKPCNHMYADGCFYSDGYLRKFDDNSQCINETEC